MSRVSALTTSMGVGSEHVGLRDLNGTERRATFQLVSNSPFFAEILATNNFNFDTNIGSNWFPVTRRVFFDQGEDDPDFVIVGGKKQRRRQSKGQDITVAGIYAMDEGFMPAAFSVQVHSITSGSPVSIFFGI